MSKSPTAQFQFNDLVQSARYHQQPEPSKARGAQPSLDLSNDELKDLQCGILRSTHSIRRFEVFRRFTSRSAFLEWLQDVHASDATGTPRGDGALVNIMFTHAGLSLLGVSETILGKMDLGFRRGARHPQTLSKLLDTSPGNWGDHKTAWHAVELLAFRDANLAEAFRRSQAMPKEAKGVVHVEFGSAFDEKGEEIVNSDQPHFGHFGIPDLRRDPVYTQKDYEVLIGDAEEPQWQWDPRHPLSTLLAPDPLSSSGHSFGSYFVYRKYKQDVYQLVGRIGEIAATISIRMREGRYKLSRRLNPVDRNFAVFKDLKREDFDQVADLVARLLPKYSELDARELGEANADIAPKEKPRECLAEVLRTDAGSAIVASIFGVDPKAWRSGKQQPLPNFNYSDDVEGSKCPFSAHARKMNPRGLTKDERLERRVTVARRSISYRKGDETGLLFWCAQASIADQFEYIQEKWANAVNTNPEHQPTPGVDSLIGQMTPESKARYERWVETTEVHSAVWEAVTHLASEYLYAPSLSGLEALKNPSSPVYDSHAQIST